MVWHWAFNSSPQIWKIQREKLWLGAIQELPSQPISAGKTRPVFKGELILKIDPALGIYTRRFGRSQPVTAGLHIPELALFSLDASGQTGRSHRAKTRESTQPDLTYEWESVLQEGHQKMKIEHTFNNIWINNKIIPNEMWYSAYWACRSTTGHTHTHTTVDFTQWGTCYRKTECEGAVESSGSQTETENPSFLLPWH